MSEENKKKEVIQTLKNEETLVDIEELKVKLNISDSVFYGVLASRGWVKGKKITQAEMNKAVKEFLNAPLK